jgi:hypothetical protein
MGPPSGITPKWPSPSFQVLTCTYKKPVALKLCSRAKSDPPEIWYFPKRGDIRRLFRGHGHHFLWNPKTGSPKREKEPDTGPEKPNPPSRSNKHEKEVSAHENPEHR